MSNSSTHCVANRQQSLIDKGFAKSRRQIYELIGLRYKICRIASLSYLFNCINYKFLAHSIKSLIDRANLKKRLGLRFTKIRKRPVIGERPWGRNECVTNEPQRMFAGRLRWGQKKVAIVERLKQ